MRAYLIGQSPSVGKKGWEWADLDNFNAVYFGTAIITAIDKTPALSSQSESLRKTYDKLRDFCDKQNEENDLPDEKQYRLGLLVTGGKPTFFELPSADSIPCNWSKLTTVLDSETVYNATDKTPNQDVKTASSSEQIQPVCECGKPMTSDNSRGLWKCRNSDHDVQIHGKKSRKKNI